MALHSMSTPSPNRAVQGYLGAVAAATLAFAVQRNMAFLFVDSLSPLQLDHLLILSVAMSIIAVVTCVVALGPWLLAVQLAERIGIRSLWYYALWGTTAGLVLGPPVFALLPGFMLEGEAVMPWFWTDRLVVDLLNVGPVFAISGATGGAIYWWINGRRTVGRA